MSFDITPPNSGKREEGKGKNVSPPPLPPNPTPLTASPIADLSYRNYDGPLHTRTLRWWTITLAMIRLNIKKVVVWIVVMFAVAPYIINGIQLYFESRMSNPMTSGTSEMKFAPTFFTAFTWQLFFLFLLALIVGSGSIAADNRANALLVYLAKPITKGDYLLGKWMSVFLILFATALCPALLLYLFCLLSYLSDGFLKNEPWLIVRILGIAMVPGVIHASLLVGLSSRSKSPSLVGAAYAGLYFVSTTISAIFWLVRYNHDPSKGLIEQHLSISGVMQGLGQNILGVTRQVTVFRNRLGTVSIEPPELVAMLLLCGVLVVIGVMAARMQIRAVEVVRG